MSNQHPITPPPELIEQWFNQSPHIEPEGYIATQAAQWGADQELEACIDWLEDLDLNVDTFKLQAARRPNPPSLKEQALARTDAILNDPNRVLLVEVRETLELNRRALEELK